MAVYQSKPMVNPPNVDNSRPPLMSGRMGKVAPTRMPGRGGEVAPTRPMAPIRTARHGGAMRGSRPANTRGYR